MSELEDNQAADDAADAESWRLLQASELIERAQNASKTQPLVAVIDSKTGEVLKTRVVRIQQSTKEQQSDE